jgi:two-component system response regulator AtoC
MPGSILIVDDERHMCVSLSKLLGAHGFQSVYEINVRRALDILRKRTIDLVITDLKMPGMDGIRFIDAVKSMKLPVPVIMISGYATVENVVEAMRFGALNFYPKPINFPKLLEEIKNVLQVRKSQEQQGGAIVSENPRMQELLVVANTAAPTDAPVIITGESGTGKELFAAHIHAMSHRKDKPYVKLNCAAIPDTLLESELFGHVKGAFTDAREERQGRFEIAEGGTLFFDEIGEMSIKTQAKLLRVLQEKEFERVGSSEARRTNVRLVAASNKDLSALIRKGDFREDLYYRLSVITIEIPPLRERKEDVLPLARYFLTDFGRVYNKQIEEFSQEVSSIFLHHDWPGNVRELKNTVERAVIFCNCQILSADHLPQQYRSVPATEADTLQTLYDKVTREVILDALEKTSGSRQKAAELLNINRRTLYNKMKQLNLD